MLLPCPFQMLQWKADNSFAPFQNKLTYLLQFYQGLYFASSDTFHNNFRIQR